MNRFDQGKSLLTGSWLLSDLTTHAKHFARLTLRRRIQIIVIPVTLFFSLLTFFLFSSLSTAMLVAGLGAFVWLLTLRVLRFWVGTAFEEIALLSLLRNRPLQLRLTRGDSTQEKLVYVLHNSLPFSSGGYANRAQGFAESLQQAGATVTCVTRPGFPSDLSAFTTLVPPSSWKVGTVMYESIASPSYKNSSGFSYVLRASRALLHAIRDKELTAVVAASNYLTGLPSLIAAKRLGVPFIYEVRGFWEITRVSRDPEFAGSREYRKLVHRESLVAKNADLVITLGEGMKRELEARGVSPERISIAPNSVASASVGIPKPEASFRRSIGVAQEAFVIGFVGTLVDYEGIDDLLHACGILLRRKVNFHLVIVGSDVVSGGFGRFGDLMKELSESLGLSEKVTFFGRVSPEEARKFLGVIDVAAYPRKRLPVTQLVSPLKPVEALARGVPLVVSNLAPLAELVGEDERGLKCEPGSPESLANQLERFANGAELRSAMAKQAVDWVRANRTWEQVGSSVVDSIRAIRESELTYR